MDTLSAPPAAADPPTRNPPDRGEIARQKLLAAAIDVFGRLGFDGTTTRVIAAQAGVNQQAIPYYFGGKEGLYVAAADHISGKVSERLSSARETVQARISRMGGQPIGPDEARALLTAILQPLADLLASDESAEWARFMVREQMTPTEAFSRMYGRTMGPLLGIVTTLVGITLEEPADSERVRLRTASLIGGILVFRVANTAAMRLLGWKNVGEQERQAIHAHVADLVASVRYGNRP
jgi:AcrR family transcriptional regulator